MASSKPKHVAMLSLIVYISNLCYTKILLLLNFEKYTTGMSLLQIIIMPPLNKQQCMSCCSSRRSHHRHHEELGMKYGLSNGPPVLYYKCELQSMLENCNNKLYYGRSVTTDRTVRNNRPDIVMLHKTAKEAHSVDAAIPNSHNLHSTIIERLQQYTDWKGELTRIQQLKTAQVPLVLSTEGFISSNSKNGPYSTTSTVHRG